MMQRKRVDGGGQEGMDAPEDTAGEAVEGVAGRELQAEVCDVEKGGQVLQAACRWVKQKRSGLQLR